MFSVSLFPEGVVDDAVELSSPAVLDYKYFCSVKYKYSLQKTGIGFAFFFRGIDNFTNCVASSAFASRPSLTDRTELGLITLPAK